MNAAIREWGKVVANKYHKCVGVLEAIENLDDLRDFTSLRFHPLKGQRKNQYALKLDNRWRLIFSHYGSKLEIIRIDEVSKHYGD